MYFFYSKCNLFAALLLTLSVFSSCSNKISKSFLTRDKILVETSLAEKKSPCSTMMNYAPDAANPHHTPMRYVRVNFHIINHQNGTLNFNLQDGITYVRGLLEHANWRLRNNEQVSLPAGNNLPVLPIQYQYVLTPSTDEPDDAGVYVHFVEDELALNDKKSTKRTIYDGTLYERYGLRKGEVLNIFMLEHHPDSVQSPTYKASLDGVGLSEWAKVVGLYQHAFRTETREDGSTVRTGPHYQIGILNHEIGHSLGLAHTWNTNDGCDDTPQHPGCWDQFSAPCRETGVYSNNMMDYNNCQCALSPCQLAKIHYNFARDNTSQRKILKPVWCDYQPDKSVTIGWGQQFVWNSAKDLEGDLIINNGAELTIQCNVSLPAGAKVIVKPKGTLILEGGKITNRCGDLWEGIEVWKNKKSEGKVVYSGNAEMEHLKNKF